MPLQDIPQFIEKLESAGELRRVKTQVDANLEIAEILRRTMYNNGPAVLFENVKDYDMPVSCTGSRSTELTDKKIIDSIQ